MKKLLAVLVFIVMLLSMQFQSGLFTSQQESANGYIQPLGNEDIGPKP